MRVFDENNIYETIQQLMEQAEDIIDLSGDEKKVLVLNNLKAVLGEEVYERYGYMFGSTIDFIVSISKSGFKTSINKLKKKKYFCCNI